MNHFDQLDNDLTPVGIITMAISWMDIFGVVKLNPFLQTIVYLMTIAWLSMQMFSFVKKHFRKRK
jgi:hypothetical protein